MKKPPELQPHPASEVFRMMTEEEFLAHKEDIHKNGQREAIVLLDGMILDGRNRYRACLELKREPRTVSVEADAIGDPLAYVLSVNLHRRHLSATEKRAVVAEVLKGNPRQSDRQAAAKVGVDHKTVGAVRRELEGRGEIPHIDERADTRGRQQPAKKSTGAAAKPTKEERAERAEARRRREEESKPEFKQVVTGWTGTVEGIAEVVEEVRPEDLELFKKTEPFSAKELSAAIERLGDAWGGSAVAGRPPLADNPTVKKVLLMLVECMSELRKPEVSRAITRVMERICTMQRLLSDGKEGYYGPRGGHQPRHP
jgi:hypothetical protein